MTRIGACLAAIVALVTQSVAAEFGRGRLPIEFDPGSPVAFDARDEIVIEGEVLSGTPVEVVLRTDDTQSSGYSSRAHDSRRLPPGPFRMVVRLDGMRASGGRSIDSAAIRRLILFVPERKGDVVVTRFESVRAAGDGVTPLDQLKSAAKSLPVEWSPSGSLRLTPEDVLHVEGVLEGGAPATVALRIDDGRSADYDTRVNREDTVQPGPFQLAYRLSEQATRAGRKLDLHDVRRVILFALEAGTPVRLTRFEIVRPAAQAADAASAVPSGPPSLPSAREPMPGRDLQLAWEPARPFEIGAGDEIRIEGRVDGRQPAVLVVRVDDDRSTDARSRFSAEHKLAPGPFKIAVRGSELRAGDGRALNLRSLRRLMVYATANGEAVRIGRFDLFGSEARVAAASAGAASGAITPLEQLRSTATAMPVEWEGRTLQFGDADVLQIEGQNEGKAPVTVVLRVDDGQTKDYSGRAHVQQTVLPGAFKMSVKMAGLRNESGRILDHRNIAKMVLFALNKDGQPIRLSRLEVTRGDAAGSAAPSPAPAASTPQPANGEARPPRPLLLGSGVAPVRFIAGTGTRFEDDDELRVEGIIDTKAALMVLVRIDDGRSRDYGSRVNIERELQPGPFKLTVPVKGQQVTSKSRVIDHRDIRLVVFATDPHEGTVRVDKMSLERAPRLPAGAKAYALGPADAPLLGGMERLGPNDPRVKGQGIRTVRRPAPDPLVAAGLLGVEQVRLPHPPGRARVSLFTEDPGEWETLPPVLQRRIRVNGQEALATRWTPEEWLRRRYMRGAGDEHTLRDDAWTAYGSKRGDIVSIEVDVGQDGIVIDLAGTERHALYLAGVIVEPAGSSAALDHIQSLRRDWYRDNYPTGKAQVAVSDTTHPVRLPAAGRTGAIAPARAAAAAGTGVRLRLAVTAEAAMAQPRIAVEAPRLDGQALGMQVWAGQRRLALLGSLQLDDQRMVADVSALPIGTEAPRHYEVWITVPETAAAGIHRGAIVFGAGPEAGRVPVEIEVLPTRLPAAGKPAGFYMNQAHYLSWFPDLKAQRGRQLVCDYDLLRSFATLGTVPESTDVETGDLALFAADMISAQRGGVAPGWLVYQSFWERRIGAAAMARRMQAASRVLAEAGVPQPVWSVADEPSNVDISSGGFPALVKELRALAPGMRLGGHLNAREDAKFVPLLDVPIINSGFGLDAGTIDKLAADGKTVWIYNTGGHARLSAGVWLWRTKAQRYIQWHARGVVADPFDPLDGRERDHQMIYPSAQVCPQQPDIDRELLRMAEGVVDQRWLAWLDAQRGAEAIALARDLRQRSGDTWAQATRFTAADLDAIRARIVALARHTR